MPHLKVTPFDTSIIEQQISKSPMMTFCATAMNRNDMLIGIEHAGEEFLLQLKPDENAYLLKYDKVTRPLKVNLLKAALESVSKELKLDVLSSNIAISNTKSPL